MTVVLVSSRMLLLAQAGICPPQGASDGAAQARILDLDLADFEVQPGDS